MNTGPFTVVRAYVITVKCLIGPFNQFDGLNRTAFMTVWSRDYPTPPDTTT
jgi:hypothetical protein